MGFSFITISCSYTLTPNVVIKPISQYKLWQVKEGLEIAVEPFFEKERMKTLFETDLLSYGILPVLVVIENNHPNSGFLFDKRNFSIAIKEEDSDSKTGTVETMSKYKKLDEYPGITLAMGTIGMIAPITMAPGVAIGIYDTLKERDNEKIRQNLMRKAFLDKTIFPKESYSGFLYFQMKDLEGMKKVVAVLIKAKNVISNEEQTFVFQIRR